MREALEEVDYCWQAVEQPSPAAGALSTIKDGQTRTNVIQLYIHELQLMNCWQNGHSCTN
jgi:hypothetical protein